MTDGEAQYSPMLWKDGHRLLAPIDEEVETQIAVCVPRPQPTRGHQVSCLAFWFPVPCSLQLRKRCQGKH